MTYEEALKQVDKMTDGLGMPIDPSIKPLVAALHMHDFSTTASCEGHLGRALAYP